MFYFKLLFTIGISLLFAAFLSGTIKIMYYKNYDADNISTKNYGRCVAIDILRYPLPVLCNYQPS